MDEIQDKTIFGGLTPEQESEISKAYKDLEAPKSSRGSGDYIQSKMTGEPTEKTPELKAKDYYWEKDPVIRTWFEKSNPEDPRSAFDKFFDETVSKRHLEDTKVETERVALGANIGWGDQKVQSSTSQAAKLSEVAPSVTGEGREDNIYFGAIRSVRQAALSTPEMVNDKNEIILLRDGDTLEDVYGNTKYNSSDGRKVVAITYVPTSKHGNEKPKLKLVYEGDRPEGEIVSVWDMDEGSFMQSNTMSEQGLKMIPKIVAKSAVNSFWDMAIGATSVAKSLDVITGGEDESTKDKQDTISRMSKYRNSKSDYDAEHFLSTNNVAEFGVNVVVQLLGAKGIGTAASLLARGASGGLLAVTGLAKSASAVKNTAAFTHKATSAATVLSLSLLGVEPIKDEARNAGWSEEEASYLSIAYLGAMMAANTISDKILTQDDYLAAKKLAKDIATKEMAFAPESVKTSEKAMISFAKSIAKRINNANDKLIGAAATSRAGMIGIGAGAEASEEILEQLLQDGLTTSWSAVKSMGKDYDPNKEKLLGLYDPEYWQNAPTEYLMSGLGGAFGGGLMKSFGKLTRLPFTKEDNYSMAKLAAMVGTKGTGGLTAEMVHEQFRKAYKSGAMGSHDYSTISTGTGDNARLLRMSELTPEQKKSALSVADANYRMQLARFQTFSALLDGTKFDDIPIEVQELFKDNATVAGKLAKEQTELIDKQTPYATERLAKGESIKDSWLAYVNDTAEKEEKKSKEEVGKVKPMTTGVGPEEDPSVEILNKHAKEYAEAIGSSVEEAKDLLLREEYINDITHGRTMERDVLDILIMRNPEKYKGLTSEKFINNFGTGFFHELLNSDFRFFESSKAKEEQHTARAQEIKEQIEGLTDLNSISEFRKTFTDPNSFFVDDATKSKFDNKVTEIAVNMMESTPTDKDLILSTARNILGERLGITIFNKETINAKVEELETVIKDAANDMVSKGNITEEDISTFIEAHKSDAYKLALLKKYSKFLDGTSEVDSTDVASLLNTSIIGEDMFNDTFKQFVQSYFEGGNELDITDDENFYVLTDRISKKGDTPLVNTVGPLSKYASLKDHTEYFNRNANTSSPLSGIVESLQKYLFSSNGKDINTIGKTISERVDEIVGILESTEERVSSYNPSEEIDDLIDVSEARMAQLQLMLDSLPYIQALTKHNKNAFKKSSLDLNPLLTKNSKLSSYYNKLLFNVDEYAKLSDMDSKFLTTEQKVQKAAMDTYLGGMRIAIDEIQKVRSQLISALKSAKDMFNTEFISKKFKDDMIKSIASVSKSFDVLQADIDLNGGLEDISKLITELKNSVNDINSTPLMDDVKLAKIYQDMVNLGSALYNLTPEDKNHIYNVYLSATGNIQNKMMPIAFLSQNISSFLTTVKDIYSNDTTGILPTMPQELAAFASYAFVTADTYNDKYSDEFGENFLKRMNNDLYSGGLENIIFIPGGYGTGKTQIIAGVVAKAVELTESIANNNACTMVMAPNEDQTINLRDAATKYNVTIPDGRAIDIKTLATLLNNESTDWEALLNHITTIVLDEATLMPYDDDKSISGLTRLMEVINNVNTSRREYKLAPISLIALGDSKQASFRPGMDNPFDPKANTRVDAPGKNSNIGNLTDIMQTPPLTTKFRAYVNDIDTAANKLLSISDALVKGIGSIGIKTKTIEPDMFSFGYANSLSNNPSYKGGVEVTSGTPYTDELLENIKANLEANPEFTVTIIDNYLENGIDSLPENWKKFQEENPKSVLIRGLISAQGSERDYIIINLRDENGESWLPNPLLKSELEYATANKHRFNILSMLVGRARFYARINAHTASGLSSQEMPTMKENKTSLMDYMDIWSDFRKNLLGIVKLTESKENDKPELSVVYDFHDGEIVTMMVKNFSDELVASSDEIEVKNVSDTTIEFFNNTTGESVTVQKSDIEGLAPYVRKITTVITEEDKKAADSLLKATKNTGKVLLTKKLPDGSVIEGQLIREGVGKGNIKYKILFNDGSLQEITKDILAKKLAEKTIMRYSEAKKTKSITKPTLPPKKSIEPTKEDSILVEEVNEIITDENLVNSVAKEPVMPIFIESEKLVDNNGKVIDTNGQTAATKRAKEALDVLIELETRGIGLSYPMPTIIPKVNHNTGLIVENRYNGVEDALISRYHYLADSIGHKETLNADSILDAEQDFYASKDPEKYFVNLVSYQFKEGARYVIGHAITVEVKSSGEHFILGLLPRNQYKSGKLAEELKSIEDTLPTGTPSSIDFKSNGWIESDMSTNNKEGKLIFLGDTKVPAYHKITPLNIDIVLGRSIGKPVVDTLPTQSTNTKILLRPREGQEFKLSRDFTHKEVDGEFVEKTAKDMVNNVYSYGGKIIAFVEYNKGTTFNGITNISYLPVELTKGTDSKYRATPFLGFDKNSDTPKPLKYIYNPKSDDFVVIDAINQGIKNLDFTSVVPSELEELKSRFTVDEAKSVSIQGLLDLVNDVQDDSAVSETVQALNKVKVIAKQLPTYADQVRLTLSELRTNLKINNTPVKISKPMAFLRNVPPTSNTSGKMFVLYSFDPGIDVEDPTIVARAQAAFREELETSQVDTTNIKQYYREGIGIIMLDYESTGFQGLKAVHEGPGNIEQRFNKYICHSDSKVNKRIGTFLAEFSIHINRLMATNDADPILRDLGKLLYEKAKDGQPLTFNRIKELPKVLGESVVDSTKFDAMIETLRGKYVNGKATPDANTMLNTIAFILSVTADQSLGKVVDAPIGSPNYGKFLIKDKNKLSLVFASKAHLESIGKINSTDVYKFNLYAFMNELTSIKNEDTKTGIAKMLDEFIQATSKEGTLNLGIKVPPAVIKANSGDIWAPVEGTNSLLENKLTTNVKDIALPSAIFNINRLIEDIEASKNTLAEPVTDSTEEFVNNASTIINTLEANLSTKTPNNVKLLVSLINKARKDIRSLEEVHKPNMIAVNTINSKISELEYIYNIFVNQDKTIDDVRSGNISIPKGLDEEYTKERLKYIVDGKGLRDFKEYIKATVDPKLLSNVEAKLAPIFSLLSKKFTKTDIEDLMKNKLESFTTDNNLVLDDSTVLEGLRNFTIKPEDKTKLLLAYLNSNSDITRNVIAEYLLDSQASKLLTNMKKNIDKVTKGEAIEDEASMKKLDLLDSTKFLVETYREYRNSKVNADTELITLKTVIESGMTAEDIMNLDKSVLDSILTEFSSLQDDDNYYNSSILNDVRTMINVDEKLKEIGTIIDGLGLSKDSAVLFKQSLQTAPELVELLLGKIDSSTLDNSKKQLIKKQSIELAVNTNQEITKKLKELTRKQSCII